MTIETGYSTEFKHATGQNRFEWDLRQIKVVHKIYGCMSFAPLFGPLVMLSWFGIYESHHLNWNIVPIQSISILNSNTPQPKSA